MVPDRIIKVIQTLLDKVERGAEGSSQAEVEEAAVKAQELLLKYNLDQREVMAQSLGEKEEAIIEEVIDLNAFTKVTEGQWFMNLIYALSRANMCLALHRSSHIPKNVGMAVVFGKPMNVEIVKYLIDSIRNRLKTMAKEGYAKTKGTIYFNPNQNAFRRAYLDGAVRGIRSKLESATNDLKRLNSQMGLMVLTEEQKVNAFINSKYKVSTKKASNYGDVAARGMGFTDGQGMGLNKGVSGGMGRNMLN